MAFFILQQPAHQLRQHAFPMADNALAITPSSMSHFGDLQATRISSCPQLMCPSDDRCQNEPMYHFIRQDLTKPRLIGNQLHASQST